MADYDIFQEQVPGTAAAATYRLGHAFSSGVDGSITAIKFYKHNLLVTDIVAKLYNSEGTELASKTRVGDGTGPAWVTITFDTPYAAKAGVGYVATVYVSRYYYTNTSAQGGALDDITISPLWANSTSGRYNASDAFPSTTSTTYYGVDVVFSYAGDWGVDTIESNGLLGAKAFHGPSHINICRQDPHIIGLVKNTTEGDPAQPSMELKYPSKRRFRWGVVGSSDNTITVNAKQVSNEAGYRPRLTVKANPDIGINADDYDDAGDTTGWDTLSVTVTPSSSGVVWVELENRDVLNLDSSAYFDHITTSVA